ncbi:methyltransferase domain-containing protein [Chaetomium sp. MPI-SDFR-AT-0129]|nr:methyltransferase domain-containing protein [Chaetomium sp. MPI-SDFR-AT-0129]
MLPTPSTSHVPYARVYEPAEDSFLLLDTLSSASETAFLAGRFPFTPTSTTPPTSPTSPTTSDAAPATPSPTPLILEVGPGSGVVLAFLTAHAAHLFGGRRDVLTLGIDVNRVACEATRETVRRAVVEAEAEAQETSAPDSAEPADKGAKGKAGTGYHLGTAQGDLATAVRPQSVDVLVFNPPYVPTPDVPPMLPSSSSTATTTTSSSSTTSAFEEDSRLLALSYAGGRDGMEVTDRLIDALPEVLSDRGVAYLLLCAQNKPEEVKGRIRGMGGGEGDARQWRAETVGTSGRQAGWEKLQIVRIWRD